MIRILIADDNQHVRDYFKKLVGNYGDLVVAGEAVDGQEAVLQVQQAQADILLLDIEMPRITGIEVLQRIEAIQSNIRVLVISSYIDRELIRGTLELGARGYISKEEAPAALVPAIRAICADQPVWLSQRAAASLFA